MRRLWSIVLLSAVFCVLVLPVSCSRESPAYNRENIKATWLIDTRDGNLLDERDWTVVTFDKSNVVTWSGVLTLDDTVGCQWGDNTLMYEIYCCDFSIYGTFTGLFGFVDQVVTTQQYDFVHSEDSLMTLGLSSLIIGGQEVTPEFSQMTMRKLPSTYAVTDTIAGVWQFNTRDGADFSNYRIQFQGDGSLIISSRTGENAWQPMGGGEDYFRLYDDFLALTVYDNAEFGTPSRWDVKCFQIDSISSQTGSMAMHSSGQHYVLSFISPN